MSNDTPNPEPLMSCAHCDGPGCDLMIMMSRTCTKGELRAEALRLGKRVTDLESNLEDEIGRTMTAQKEAVDIAKDLARRLLRDRWFLASEPPPSADRSYMVYMTSGDHSEGGFIAVLRPWKDKNGLVRFEKAITHWAEKMDAPSPSDSEKKST